MDDLFGMEYGVDCERWFNFNLFRYWNLLISVIALIYIQKKKNATLRVICHDAIPRGKGKLNWNYLIMRRDRRNKSRDP